MTGFIATFVATGVALWVAARFVPGIEIPSSAFARVPDDLVDFGTIAVVFGLANGLIGSIVRTLAMPVNFLTMGLAGFVVNIALFAIAAYVSNELGGSIRVGDFPPEMFAQATIVAAALGSLVVGVVSAVVRLVIPD
ncbi:MAG TPA: phage holin family protein [Patescibacteria group bacterium]|nr:phage holin family protein [Patescibacteria group bacterium]